MNNTTSKPNFQAWFIWAIAALFYAYEYYLRLSPNVMTHELIRAFSTNAEAIGTLSACYYYAYASMQIPVGLIYDKFGVRRALLAASLVVSLSCVMLATSHHLILADSARLLMGLGSAFAFVGCLSIGRTWFAPKQFPLIVGLTNTLGVIGAIAGFEPLAKFVGFFGWRMSFMIAAVCGLSITILITLFIKEKSTHVSQPHANKSEWLTRFKLLTQNKTLWLSSLFATLVVVPIAAFGELWGTPFLKLHLAIAKPEAAALASFVFIGIAIGGPCFGWLSKQLHTRKALMAAGTCLAFTSLTALIYGPCLPSLITGGILFCFGFGSSAMLLCFAINVESSTELGDGLVIGFTNMLIMLGGTVFQPLTGYLLDKGKTMDLQDYQHALILLPACQLIALILLRWLNSKSE